jgi:hypothetical protein
MGHGIGMISTTGPGTGYQSPKKVPGMNRRRGTLCEAFSWENFLAHEERFGFQRYN